MIVEYNGKSIETLMYSEVSDEERLQLKEQFFAKPDFSQVIKQLQTLSKDGIMVDKVTRYYFRDLMAKVYIKGSKWSVEDVFESNDLLGIFKAKIQTNNRVFDSNSTITNIETAIRLGGHSIANMPPNFPMKTARNIVNKYNINNNWYDFSCGWGVRLICAMSNNINYYGTDPNYLLTERLIQLKNDYAQHIGLKSIVDIRTQGSEDFIPEWENTIGLAFSSPPYFDLENYRIGKQSYNENVSYDNWKINYLQPTLKNIYKYLIPEGILAINIKNGKTYKLADDTKAIAEACGFHLINIELLNNSQRVTPSGLINNAENIFIFKKDVNSIIIDMSANTDIIELKEKEKEEEIEDLIYDNDNEDEPMTNSLKKIDIYLIGVKSKKQLDDKNIYNTDNIFLGERYFATFSDELLQSITFLNDYKLGKYIEVTKQNIIDILNYTIYHKDCNNSFKTVGRLCEIIDTWEEMEDNNFHVFLQIEKN